MYSLLIATIITIIFGMNHSVYAQKVNPLIRLEESYEFEKLQSYLDMVEKQGSEHVPARYLKALLSDDGPQALANYQDVVARDSLGIYADRALWRIAQYYYIKGDYSKAHNVLLGLVGRYPNSKFVSKARTKMARITALNSGAQKTAGHPSAAAVSAASSSSTVSSERGRFTIQAGAFSGRDNAVFMQRHLKEQGFSDVYISKRQIGGKLLYLVWVGSYVSRERAAREKDRLRKKIRNIEFFIKSLP